MASLKDILLKIQAQTKFESEKKEIEKKPNVVTLQIF